MTKISYRVSKAGAFAGTALVLALLAGCSGQDAAQRAQQAAQQAASSAQSAETAANSAQQSASAAQAAATRTEQAAADAKAAADRAESIASKTDAPRWACLSKTQTRIVARGYTRADFGQFSEMSEKLKDWMERGEFELSGDFINGQ